MLPDRAAHLKFLVEKVEKLHWFAGELTSNLEDILEALKNNDGRVVENKFVWLHNELEYINIEGRQLLDDRSLADLFPDNFNKEMKQ